MKDFIKQKLHDAIAGKKDWLEEADTLCLLKLVWGI